MTCEFRFGAPYWGTGGPEFKSRRSDHNIKDLEQVFRASVSRETPLGSAWETR
jgi:hypothetical protein